MTAKKSGVTFSNREFVVEGTICRVAHLDADDYKFIDDPDAAISVMRKAGVRADLFTFLQRLPDTAVKYPYPLEMDNLAVLSISTYENWWTKQIGFKARNKAKQAEKKGVVVREAAFDDDLVRGIWEIYNESPVRQDRRFPHYGKSLEMVRNMSATYLDSSVFIGAYDTGKLIGFIKLVIDDTRTQAGMMHIISSLESRDKAPTNALVAHAVRSCAERQISHLVYSKFAYGKKAQSSLSDFKERNAFQPVDVPRYYVPLSAWGKAAFSMGLHHRLADRLPESFMSKLRDLRSAWLQRKFQLKAESL